MFVPKVGEEYYYLTFKGMVIEAAKKKRWEFDGFDITMFMMDNVFKSKGKAKKNKDKVIEGAKKFMSEVRV